MERIVVAVALTVAGCAPGATTQPLELPHQSDGRVASIAEEVSGVVIERCAYGPPNYGESPSSDRRKRFALLILDEPIKQLTASGSSGSSQVAEVAAVQLVSSTDSKGGSNLASLVGQQVHLKVSEWMEAETGHHHTRVLLSYDSVLERQPAQSTDWPDLGKDLLGTPCDGYETSGDGER